MEDCIYCGKEETIIFKIKEISTGSWGWGGDFSIKESETIKSDMGLFIDRREFATYLRYADTDDCGCLESGEKIEIIFCPFCGERL